MTAQSLHPEVVVGGYILNDKKEVLLVRSPKWDRGKMWLVAGGHIEYGETIAAALEREIREELGIQVKFDKVFLVAEDIYSPTFRDRKRHFIYLQSLAWIKPGEKIKLDGREIVEARWWNIKKALELPSGSLHEKTREALKRLVEEI